MTVLSGPLAPRTLAAAPGTLPFVAAGVLDPADVEVAVAATRAVPDVHPDVVLAAALAVRATRLGHVGVALAELPRTVVPEGAAAPAPGAGGGADARPDGGSDDVASVVDALPWPEPGAWARELAASGAVAVADPHGGEPRSGVVGEELRPLVWDGARLYLERYWRHERRTGDELLRRAAEAPVAADERVRSVLDRLFGPDPDDLQRRAAEAALTRRLVVLAGGPGTGKTHTVARILAALHLTTPDGARPPEVALAAPTGKAAQRMTAAVAGAVAGLQLDATTADALVGVEATTLHRLLGPTGGPAFRHDRHDPLPHDVVVVDEASMVSLPLVARLLDALRPDARVLLVGDPDQLASIEAGAVLGDVVGGARAGRDGPLAPGTVVLRRVHRFGEGSPIAEVADAVRRGDVERTVALLAEGRPGLTWVRPEDGPARRALDAEVTGAAEATVRAALEGDAGAGLTAAASCKVLAATRRGPLGTWDWQERIERAVATAVPEVRPQARWYVGRPVMVTRNDRHTGLVNGDTGLTVDAGEAPSVVIGDPRNPDALRSFAPSQLDAVETWWAMTIHKSQGSEYDHVVVSLPWAASRILTRELLYTGITRARAQVTVLGTEEAVRAAVARPVTRASGLAPRLWPD